MTNEDITLYELNNLVKGVLELELSSLYWIVAETSDVRANQNGHCYLELIQKDTVNKSIVAKARAMIWSSTYHLLKNFFEDTTHQSFASGLKVLIQVSIQFHEVYGYSLTIHDINPEYTLGDQAKQKAAIIKQLQDEGVFDLNKELNLPRPLQRIAIISSPTAAGYEDFCNQLHNNAHGFKFYTRLFPAIMQGERTESSIIYALECIYDKMELFDAVIIIRGGGSSSELNCFDTYLLAASCAQFPLPIITGIGHERDETILDLVAHTKAKTPTAVAELLINLALTEYNIINDFAIDLKKNCDRRLQQENQILNHFEIKNTLSLKNHIQQQTLNLEWITKSLKNFLTNYTKQENQKLQHISKQLCMNSRLQIENKSNEINTTEKYIDLLSPLNMLKKGYTYTLKDGKLVKSKDSLTLGDKITTVFHDGEIASSIN